MPLRSDIVGVVLAGGASSRMGVDKAILPLGGAPIITYAARALSDVFADVIVSSGGEKRYSFLFSRTPAHSAEFMLRSCMRETDLFL